MELRNVSSNKETNEELEEPTSVKEDIMEREEWIYTYADMFTLLMCFFIILFASTKTEEERLKAISLSLRGGPPASPYLLKGGPSLFDELEVNMKTSVLLDDITINIDDRGVSAQLGNTILFRQGSSRLSQSATEIIAKFTHLIHVIPNSIVIEGHTDSTFTKNEYYVSDWELSSARASRVAEELIRNRIDSKRIEVVAYGSNRPRVANRTAEGRQLNNRVEILIRPND